MLNFLLALSWLALKKNIKIKYIKDLQLKNLQSIRHAIDLNSVYVKQ